jgi:hypothetical protein
MSYLDTPRLHFTGRFQADVSTVNNDPEHFDEGRFLANYQEPGSGGNDGWWNPTGSGAWRLAGCTVCQLVPPPAEPLLGATLSSNEGGAPAKLVDLDPEQQMVSTIFGMVLTLRTPDGRAIVSGRFVAAPFENIWVRFPTGQADSYYSATYQSIITDLTWAEDIDSPFVTQLREAATGGALSIRMTVDGIDQDSTSPTFTWGRVVGTIGPYKTGEPRHFVAARVLTPTGGQPSLNNAPLRIDEASRELVLDLGNSLQTAAPGGPPADLGILQVVTQDAAGETLVLADVESSSAAFNDVSSGILSVVLSESQLAAALANPLSVVDPSSGNVLLAEDPEGRYVRADADVFRIYPVAPHDSVSTKLYATKFGAPAQGVEITATMNNSAMQSQVQQGPFPGPPVGIPANALQIGTPAPTDADGTTELVLTATPPGNPRGYIDGQVYGVVYGWPGDAPTSAGAQISALVFDAYDVPDVPTWTDHVAPVLTQYANLYPVMKTIVDLGSFHSVRARWEMVDLSMNLPVDDANTMPVTRDLSPGKRQTILKWLESADQPLFATETVEDLRTLLQLAIELEHSTIPPYLYALFSIKPGRNQDVAQIIRTVVVEEMLHMTLACNLLNAIDGVPVIDRPGFVPAYPCELPASVAPGLVVTTRRCSIDQVRDVFLAIEEPAETIGTVPKVDSSAVTVGSDGAADGPLTEVAAQIRDAYVDVEHHPYTIAWFYGEISKLLDRLTQPGAPNIFTGQQAKQVTPQVWPKPPGRLVAVTNAETAWIAIHEIVEQGEGTSPDNPRGTGGELAHFFRFQEIVEGHRLVDKPGGTWAYEGDPVVLDPDGVWPAVDDPQLLTSMGAAPRLQSTIFDRSYGDLLKLLHEVVNGQPQQLSAAVGLMFSLEVVAQRLMQTPLQPGAEQTAGPTFAQAPAPPTV